MKSQHIASLAGLLLLTAFSGCGGLPDGGFRNLTQFFGGSDADATELTHRERYLTERDPESLEWLMQNRVRQGMTRTEVEGILGETGIRENNDRRFKTRGGNYLTTDVCYRWGPDADGRSIFLFFRNGLLTNYDPNDFLKRSPRSGIGLRPEPEA